MKAFRSILFVAASLLAAGLPAVARGAARNEYEVKAAFLYHFVEFTDWPAAAFADKGSPIVLATLGDDPFGGILERVCAGKSIGGRALVVKHFARAADVKGCQVLFVVAGADADFPDALRAAGLRGLLTVGETGRFLDDGGIIRFYEEDKRVRFEISQAAASRAGLRISAKLLRLSKPRGR